MVKGKQSAVFYIIPHVDFRGVFRSHFNHSWVGCLFRTIVSLFKLVKPDFSRQCVWWEGKKGTFSLYVLVNAVLY